jgi:tRNA(Ile2) C34 agmatinyltransferase TiaS
MVAIGDVHDWSEYDEVATAIRKGLLAHLKPETAEKLASRNAVRVFQLDEARGAVPAK